MSLTAFLIVIVFLVLGVKGLLLKQRLAALRQAPRPGGDSGQSTSLLTRALALIGFFTVCLLCCTAGLTLAA